MCSNNFFHFKEEGKNLAWFAIALALILIVFSFLFINEIDESFYSNTDVKNDLKLANLFLENDFEIISNKVDGMPERFQDTEIKISEKDKNRIIEEIKSGRSFKNSKKSRILYQQMLSKSGIQNKIAYTNYFYKNQYIRESYYRLENYIPIFLIVSLNEESDILQFSRIED